jgi:PKD domain
MNSERILTRKTLGLDHRVWRVMIVLFVLSIGLYSYTLIDTPKCTPVDFKIKTIDNDSVFSTDEILSFSSLRFEKNITWDFGDNSPAGTGTFVTHRFAVEGKYYIKVTVNADCQFTKPITVRKAIVENINTKDQIDGHPSTFVGTGENYTTLAKAETYEWSIENHPEYGVLNGQSVSYNFMSPGDFTIKLTLDKDRFKIYRKSVTVVENEKPKPVEKIEKLIDYEKLAKLDKDNPPKEKMGISELTFADYLEKVIAGQYFAKDFNDYLCLEGRTPVIINGKSDKQVTFEQACAELNGKRKNKFLGLGKKSVHIKTVRLNRGNDNCVTMIEIKYE